MTVPHTFSDRELELIARGSVEFSKDWKQISRTYMPYLSPISAKNKYYKMAKNGQLQSLLRRHRPDDKEETSDEQTILALYRFAARCGILM